MKKLLREPLLHFLFLGSALFLLYYVVDGSNDSAGGGNQIVVDAGRIRQLATIFEKTWQRPPTEEEFRGLINEFVLEEVYYQRALVMGLDQDDTIIRRRLRQKLEFFTDDTTSLLDPSEQELGDYLADHAEEFREDPSYTFEQIYFNPERHGDRPEAYIEVQLELLRSGQPVEGDMSLLPVRFRTAARRVVDNTFGRGFSDQLDGLIEGEWQGPIQSGLGFHLVRLDARTAGSLPDLASIRPKVEREWRHAKRLENRQRFNEALLKDYEVIVEWPEKDNESLDSTGGDR